MKRLKRIALVLVTVTTMGLMALTGCTKMTSYEKYTNADLYSVGSVNMSAEAVKKVDIDWINGSIEVAQSTTQTLKIVEEKSPENAEERMRYYVDGSTLKVKYCQSGLRRNIDAQNKNLRVEIPAGLSLEIDTVSAGVTIGVLESTSLSIESESGNITAERIVGKDVEIETGNGKVSVGELIASAVSFDSSSGEVSVARLSGDFLDAETISGALSFGVQKAVRAEVESTSGDVTFTLGEGLGATVKLETATGKLKTDKQYAKTGTRYDIFGADGSSTECNIEIDVFSGDVYIR